MTKMFNKVDFQFHKINENVTFFSTKIRNYHNQGKKRGLLFAGNGLNAQPVLKQPC